MMMTAERFAICTSLNPGRNLCNLVYPDDPYSIESRPVPQIQGVNHGTILGKWLKCSYSNSNTNKKVFELTNDEPFKIVVTNYGQIEVHAPVLFLTDLSKFDPSFQSPQASSSLESELLELEYSAPVFALPEQWKREVTTKHVQNNVLYEGKLMMEFFPNSAPKWRLIDVFDQCRWDFELMGCMEGTFVNQLLKNSIRIGRLLKKHGSKIVSILSTDGVLAFGEVPTNDQNDKLNRGQWIKYFEFTFKNNDFPLKWAVGCHNAEDIYGWWDMSIGYSNKDILKAIDIDDEENVFELRLDAIAQSNFEPKICWLKGIGKLHGPEEYLYKLAVALTNEQVVFVKLQCHIYIDSQTVFWLIKQISNESFFNGKSATVTTPPPLENGYIGKSIDIPTSYAAVVTKKTAPTATVSPPPTPMIISNTESQWMRNRIAVYMKKKGLSAILIEFDQMKNKFEQFMELCIGEYTTKVEGMAIGDWFQLDFLINPKCQGASRKNIRMKNVEKLESPWVPTRIRDGEAEFLVDVFTPSNPSKKNCKEFQTTIGILTFEPIVNSGDTLWCRFDDKWLKKVKRIDISTPTATVASTPTPVVISNTDTESQEWTRNRIAVYMMLKGSAAILIEFDQIENKFKRLMELSATNMKMKAEGIAIGDWFQLDFLLNPKCQGIRKNIDLENVKKLEHPLVPTRIRDGEAEFLVVVVVPSKPNDKNSKEYQTTLGILTFEPIVNVGCILWCRFDNKCLNKVKLIDISTLKKETSSIATVAPTPMIISNTESQEWKRNRIAVYKMKKGTTAILIEFNQKKRKFERLMELCENTLRANGIGIGDWFQVDYLLNLKCQNVQKDIALENVKKLEKPGVPTRIRQGEAEFLVFIISNSNPNDENSKEFHTRIGTLTFESVDNVEGRLWCRFDDNCSNKVKQYVKRKK